MLSLWTQNESVFLHHRHPLQLKKEHTYILGISAYFHDSAAALLKDGEIVQAIQEERLSRKKQDSSLPVRSIEFCLENEGISINDIDQIIYYEKPFLKLERLLETQIWQYPFAFLPFRKTVKTWFTEKLWVPAMIRQKTKFSGKISYCEHHESHAAAVCYTSPFSDAVYLTLDGVGEWTTSSIGIFENNRLIPLVEQKYPHSTGFLYSAFTQYCGFRVNSGEYKLMGLAPYGEPIYMDIIKKELVTINDDGSIQLNLKYFHFHKGLRMINSKFESLFGHKARKPEGKMEKHYQDVAASIQGVLEEIVLRSARYAKEITGKKFLCYGGGVALNCRANQKLLESGLFEDIHIYSASGDAGGAIGTALSFWNKEKDRTLLKPASYLGKQFNSDEVTAILDAHEVRYSLFSEDELINKAAKLLSEKKVIGWFQGRDEIGPRALGNRSILASPINAEMRDHVNRSIKFREGFRPFAPVILEERSRDYFKGINHAPEMLYTYEAINGERIPACVHLDGTSRVQTVNQTENELLHKLLKAFDSITEVPVLINTSFNRRGEPMVHSPEDALRTFVFSKLDYLIIENVLISRDDIQGLEMQESTYELD